MNHPNTSKFWGSYVCTADLQLLVRMLLRLLNIILSLSYVIAFGCHMLYYIVLGLKRFCFGHGAVPLTCKPPLHSLHLILISSISSIARTSGFIILSLCAQLWIPKSQPLIFVSLKRRLALGNVSMSNQRDVFFSFLTIIVLRRLKINFTSDMWQRSTVFLI